MKRYHLGPESWPNVLRGMAITGIVLVVSSLALVALKAISPLDAILFLGPLALGFAVYGVRRQRAWWRTFEIVVDDERLVRRAAYCEDLEFLRTEIAEVGAAPGGFLVIEAMSGGKRLVVPKYLEGLPELRATLETWADESRGRRTSG